MKRLIIIIIIVVTLMSSVVFAESNLSSELQEKLKDAIVLYVGSADAYVNANKIKIDSTNSEVVPLIKDERTLVPVRFISENFGAKVDWNNSLKEVTINQGNKNIILTINSNKMFVNNVEKEIDVPAQTINERTFIPLRALVETLGKKVFWDDRGLIVISDDENIIDIESEMETVAKVINLFQPDLFPIERDGKYGFINREGKMIIEPKFVSASNFVEGFAKILINNKYGFINRKGEIIIEPKYDDAHDFSEGLALIKIGDCYGYIDYSGNIIIQPRYAVSGDFHYGLAYAADLYKDFGYINKNGKWGISPKFTIAEDFSESRAIIRDVDRDAVIDTKGNYIVKPSYNLSGPFSDGLAYVVPYKNTEFCWGYIDRNGKLVITSSTPPLFDTIFNYSEGLARVCVSTKIDGEWAVEGKWGYINKIGKIIINATFEDAYDFSEGMALVTSNNKYGFINKEGKIIINPIFVEAEGFSRGLAYVKMGDSWGYVDEKGNLIGFEEKSLQQDSNAENVKMSYQQYADYLYNLYPNMIVANGKLKIEILGVYIYEMNKSLVVTYNLSYPTYGNFLEARQGWPNEIEECVASLGRHVKEYYTDMPVVVYLVYSDTYAGYPEVFASNKFYSEPLKYNESSGNWKIYYPYLRITYDNITKLYNPSWAD